MKISKNSKLNLLFKSYGYLIYLSYLRKSQFYSEEYWKKFQLNEIRKTLLSAAGVPYYQELFKDIHFNPKYDFKSFADLEKIPVLTKDIFRKNYKQFVNPKYRGISIEYATSGSTGEPMKMLLTPYMVAIDKAMIFRHHSWSTKKFRPLIFALRSYVRKDENSKYFRFSPIENAYYFSAYDLNQLNANYYIESLIRINPDIIRGYPSSISFLCDYLDASYVEKLTNLKGIYAASETLTDFERQKIESLFGKRLFNWYGMTEPAVIIKECEMHDEMHVCYEYGYPEFLDTDIPTIKRLVTTSFYNHVMPFVRYDTGDLVELGGHPISCDRSLPVVKTVLGRKDEYLVGSNGAKQPSINFYTLFREFQKVKAFQLVQFSTLEVLANIRTISPLSPAELNTITNGLKLRLGDTIPVYIKETETFFTNADGKTLIILKKAGSYKLANYDLYSLSSQKSWENFRNKTESFKLDWNEADATPFPDVLNFISDLFKSDNILKWYPEAEHKSLLTALKNYTGVDSEENILLAHGSDNALRMVIQVFTDKSKCLVLLPTYDNFRAQTEGLGNELVNIRIDDSTDANIQLVINAIKENQPHIIYITNPNNPIGYHITSDQIESILIISKDINAMVVVDEAYYEFSQKSAVELIRKYGNLIIIRTFSKAFGLAGIRLGYVLADRNIIKELSKISNPKDVTMLSVIVGEYMLKNVERVKAYVSEVNANKEKFYAYCGENKIKYFPSEGNFVSFEVDKASDYLKFMESLNIYVRERTKYFNAEFIRVTIGQDHSFNVFLEADKKYRNLKRNMQDGSDN
ncbi:MAG: aminotransferase class I/II-fold pyridoxal phosphate-dependent enzyme [Bacteroidales bacterium]|jgi:histidinol-phosphate aminotransferase